MENKMTNNRIVKGFGWKLMERFAYQGLTLIITLVLSRILGPAQYDKLAIITIFVTIADVFVQGGLSTALIRKEEEPDEMDYSSVFCISMAIAALFYIIIFATAPALMSFFDYSELVLPLRITALVLFFSAFTSVQTAKVSRNLEFGKIFISSMAAGIISGGISIVAAICGLGVWALVIHYTINKIITFAVLLILVKWSPKLQFSKKNAGELFDFGWKIMLSSLIDAIYSDTRSIFIKKKYPEDEGKLSIYNRGQQIPQTAVTSINSALATVLLPALASYQSDKEKMREVVRRAILAGSFIIYPMMAGLLVMAKPLTHVVLGDEWIESVPIMQIYCINFAFWPTHSANLQVVSACGRSDKYLIMEILKKIFDIALLITALVFFDNIVYIAWASVISNVISSVINAWPCKKIINYSYKEQVKDVMPNIILTIIMAMCVYGVASVSDSLLVTIPAQIIVGVGMYFGLAWLLKNESFGIIKESISGLLKKKGQVQK